MIAFIKNILPRINEYSKTLDKIEVFVDKPWEMKDESGNMHEYEFARDGRLIMSINGSAIVGTWEFRPTTDRLLIDRTQRFAPKDKLLLQRAFISDGLLILKESSTEDIPFVLYNRNIIPNGDIEGYLQSFVMKSDYEKVTGTASDQIGEYIVYGENNEPLTGTRNNPEGSNKYIVFENGKKVREYYLHTYETKKGIISIQQQYGDAIGYDDIAIINDLPANGKYSFINKEDGYHHISAENGAIEGILTIAERIIVIATGILVIMVILVVIFFSYKNS